MTDLEPNGALQLGDVKVTWKPVPHPQGCLAFRIDCPDYSAVIATDVEFPKDEIPADFAEFAADTTFLIFDAQYHPAELAEHQGWGHSSWRTACRAAIDSGARHLILTHHAPDRTDLEIREIERHAKKEFKNTVAGACGMTIWPQI
jgi:ribonuclease BN (tRNA processing enzyme)